MSEPHIRFGVDPQGESVDIHDAEERVHYYRCPVCDDFLIVRHGDVNIWHYAHLSPIDASPDPNCLLRTHSGVSEWELKNKELFEKIRKSPIQKEEEKKLLPLIILKNPYDYNLRLYGILTPPSIDDVDDIDELKKVIETITVEGTCVHQKTTSDIFLFPPEPTFIQLDPNCEEYKIEIHSDPVINRVNGIWTREGMQEKDIFLGDEDRAQLVSCNSALRIGSMIYIILKDKVNDIPKESRFYRLGKKHWVLSFEVNLSTLPYIRKILPRRKIDKNAFQVNVILPPHANPNPLDPTRGVGGSEALIGITPPEHLDPVFEVVSVPLDKESDHSIPPTGLGIPRLYSTKIPKKGIRRLSIHWGSRHQLIQLLPRENQLVSSFENIKKQEHKIGIKLENDQFYVPWIEKNIIIPLEEEYDDVEKGIGFTLIAPKHYKVNLEGYFSSDGSSVAREFDVNIDRLHTIIASWLLEKCKKVKVNFGTLGNVTIFYKGENEKFDDEIIRGWLLALNSLPKKVTWSLVRKVTETHKSTAHHKICGGTKKQIRKILTQLRRKRNE